MFNPLRCPLCNSQIELDIEILDGVQTEHEFCLNAQCRYSDSVKYYHEVTVPTIDAQIYKDDLIAVENYAIEQLKQELEKSLNMAYSSQNVKRKFVWRLAQKIAKQFEKPELEERLEFIMHEYINDLLWDDKNIN